MPYMGRFHIIRNGWQPYKCKENCFGGPLVFGALGCSPVYGHVHTAAEYGCQSCICILNTVTFTHSSVIFRGVTTAFCNRTHTRKISGLTTHALCERNRTGQLVSVTSYSEREPLCCTNVRLPCVTCFHVCFW